MGKPRVIAICDRAGGTGSMAAVHDGSPVTDRLLVASRVHRFTWQRHIGVHAVTQNVGTPAANWVCMLDGSAIPNRGALIAGSNRASHACGDTRRS